MLRAALLCAIVALAGCSNASQQTATSSAAIASAAAGPTAAASGMAAPTAAPPASEPPVATAPAATPESSSEPPAATAAAASNAPSPATTPTATPNPNLLSYAYGTFVRRWTPGASLYGVNALASGSGWPVKGGVGKPIEIVFELPAQAHVTAIATRTYPPSGSTFAISDDDRTYRDIGSVTVADSSSAAPVAADGRGRFVRVTIVPPVTQGFSVVSITATGTMDSPPPARLDGQWVAADDEEGNGDRVINGIFGSIPATWSATTHRGQYATAVRDGILTVFSCTSDTNTGVWRGTITGNGATLNDETLHVVAGGTMLIGRANLRSVMAHRVARAPACSTTASGTGPEVAIFTRLSDLEIEAGDAKLVPGYRFVRTPLPLFDRQTIGNARAAVIADSCNAGKDLAPWQVGELLHWVSDGHVLVIRDADRCPSADYSFLPYAFTTSAGGHAAASGKRLEIVASSTLGSSRRADRLHYIDTGAYLHSEMQQLGDTDLMTTHDEHWCGLMYGVNVYNVGGWVHAYARYGKGLIVYNGFDEDDIYSGIPQAKRIAQLEYSQPPAGGLPCGAHVADGAPHAVSSPRPATRTTIAKALLHDKRARIYGIHFDVASAHIQPQSERVIAEIAQVLRAYPAWRMLVEGHTDSDGGAAYNLALSQHRAESVVADLTHRYRVAAARLRAVGYGETRPVASNATAAGKALNRRVELVRF